MINEEKQKALEAALGHIEKQYGKGLGNETGRFQCTYAGRAIPTGSLDWISHSV